MTRMMGSALAVIAFGLATMGCAATPIPVLYDGLEQPRYLRCTLKPDQEKVYSANYIGDMVLTGAYQPGSRVEISMFSPQRVDLRINNIPHMMFPSEGEFNGGDPGGFLKKYFVDSLGELGLPDPNAPATGGGNPLADPTAEYPEGTGDHSDVATGEPAADTGQGWRLDLMKPATAQSVRSGIAAVGMTKEQVYMAFGPPLFINFGTPATGLDLKTILDANRWIYYTGWAPRAFTFGLAGKKVFTFDGTNLVSVQ